MKIIIPSKGRPNNPSTKLIKKQRPSNLDVYMVIRESELLMYQSFLMGTGINTLVIADDQNHDDATTRNFGLRIVKRLYPEEQYIGFMDDDVLSIQGLTLEQAFVQLLFDMVNAQKTDPNIWIMSGKQNAPFMEKHAIYVNKQTVWIGFCIVDLEQMPTKMFKPTLQHGPQEITIPVETLTQGKSFASTSSVLFKVDDSTNGGMSDVYSTTSRKEREKAFDTTLKETSCVNPKYIKRSYSKTLDMTVARCNLVALRKDYPCQSFIMYKLLKGLNQQ